MGMIAPHVTFQPVQRAPFNPSRVLGFGARGPDLARAMIRALARTNPQWQLTYDASSRKFTVLGTSRVSFDTISNIFTQRVYDGTGGCQPRVCGRDRLNNIMVLIESIHPARSRN